MKQTFLDIIMKPDTLVDLSISTISMYKVLWNWTPFLELFTIKLYTPKVNTNILSYQS